MFMCRPRIRQPRIRQPRIRQPRIRRPRIRRPQIRRHPRSVATPDPSTDLLTDPSNFFRFFVIFVIFSSKFITWSRLIYFRPLFEVKIGLGRPAAGRGLRPLLTQLATPILTSKIGLGDESGPDSR
jgi:hypothetical protein